MESVKMKVDGMTCGGCVASVTRALKRVPGVSDVSVTLQGGTAQVEFDPAKTDVPALRAAIEDAGYDVTG